MKELELKLLKAQELINKHEADIKSLLEQRDRGSPTEPSSSGPTPSKEVEDLKRDIRDRLDTLNKKISNLQSESNTHDQEISYIKEMME